MGPNLLNTKEVAEYLRLNEKKVYALARGGKIPALRLTGKWLFPKAALDAWVETQARVAAGGATDSEAGARGTRGAMVVAGSDDPLLREFLRTIGAHPEMVLVAFAGVGSAEGLRAAAAGQADVAGCHLSQNGEFNLPFLPRLAPMLHGQVVTLAHRVQGMLVFPGNPLGLRGIGDLTERGARIVNRQPGAGTRLLLDRELARMGVDPAEVAGYGDVVHTHIEVAIRILRREADAGVACEAAARMVGVDFLPICVERYDLVIPEASADRPGVPELLDALRSASFRRMAAGHPGYNPSEAGVMQARF